MSKRSISNESERGAFMILTAGIILSLLIFCGFAIDGGKLFLSSLWAQRSADAAAFVGGGTVTLREDAAKKFSTGLSDDLCHAVATQAVMNLQVRGAIPTQTGTLPLGGCSFNLAAQNLSITVVPKITSATTRIAVTVSFDSRLLLLNYFPGFGTMRRVTATAESEVDPVILSVLVDTSQSMTQATSDSSSLRKLDELKKSLNAILDLFEPARDSLALISFGSRAKVEVPFGDARGFSEADLADAIDHLVAGGDTNYTDALTAAAQQLLAFKQRLPAEEFDSARTGYLIFGDGAPTAATLVLTAAGSLPRSDAAPINGEALVLPGKSPCAVGNKYYTIWGGMDADPKTKRPFLPFRLVAGTSELSKFPKVASDDQKIAAGLIPACSTMPYNTVNTLRGCVADLSFKYGCGQPTFPGLKTSQFEEVTQLSALAWADYLRVSPKSSVIYVIGLGKPAVDASDSDLGCKRKDNTPYDNEPCADVPKDGFYCGGLCLDLRKDSFLSRLAGRSEGPGVPYPTLQSAASIPSEQQGVLFKVKDQDELVDKFVAAAEALKKLRMVN